MLLNDQQYNTLKWIAQILLPALGVLYFGAGEVVPLPYVTEVVGILAALDVFLGTLLGISTKTFNAKERDYTAGNYIVDDSKEGYDAVSMEFNAPPAQLIRKRKLVFDVVHTNKKAIKPIFDYEGEYPYG